MKRYIILLIAILVWGNANAQQMDLMLGIPYKNLSFYHTKIVDAEKIIGKADTAIYEDEVLVFNGRSYVGYSQLLYHQKGMELLFGDVYGHPEKQQLRKITLDSSYAHSIMQMIYINKTDSLFLFRSLGFPEDVNWQEQSSPYIKSYEYEFETGYALEFFMNRETNLLAKVIIKRFQKWRPHGKHMRKEQKKAGFKNNFGKKRWKEQTKKMYAKAKEVRRTK
jgi:hypothetical protein